MTYLSHKAFLDGERAATYLTEEIRNELLRGTAFAITGHYYESAAELVNAVGVQILSLPIQIKNFQVLTFF